MLQNVLWPIDKLQLRNYQIPEGYNNLEEFSATDDGKYGVFLYNIYECTMNAWYCAFAIYDNTDFKTPLVHLHADQRPIFCQFHGKTFDYAPLSNCFIMVYSAYKPDSKRPTMPYLFVKPLEKKFALLPWDFTSIYYGFAEIENNTLKLYEKSPTQLDYYEERNKHKRKTGMKIRLHELTWYDTNDIDRAYSIYHDASANYDVFTRNIDAALPSRLQQKYALPEAERE